jgi:serine protease Do
MTDVNLRNRMKRPALVAALLATTMFGGGAVVGHAWSATNPAAPPITVQPAVQQAGFAELVKKVTPAVVKISTTEVAQEAAAQDMPRGMEGLPPEFRHFFEQAPGFGHQRGGEGRGHLAHALGSGFIVDPTGYIVTNNHVVDGAQQITVTTNDGDTYQAKVVGRDAKTDVAVLKIDASKTLPYVAFGDSDQAQVGDWVVAVGNPFGLSGTATAGIISAHGRSINEGPYDDFLQIDAPINPGNSGGPLFNQSGQVIGIDTAIYSPNGGNVGIGFAIPSNMASKVVAQLRDHGKVERGWLGVQMQGVTPALAKAMGLAQVEGVLVDKVLPNSPATKTLQQGDVITAFNGKTIKSPRDLAMDVADAKAGSAANLSVYREGHQQSVQVTIGNPSEQKAAQAETPRGGRVGLALAPLNDEARSALGLDDQTNGVVVARVKPGSPAAESGLQANDVITRIGQDQVTSPADAAAKIRAAEQAKKSSVSVLIVRDGTPQFLALALNGAAGQAG